MLEVFSVIGNLRVVLTTIEEPFMDGNILAGGKGPGHGMLGNAELNHNTENLILLCALPSAKSCI